MLHRRNIDMDLLRSFVTIIEQESFTRAADRLDRTQSAISLQMKRLEEQLGTRFFARSGRGVQPTEAGTMLLDYAHRILALNDELVARMVEPAITGGVRLGISEPASTVKFGRVLRRFRHAFPAVQLKVRSAADSALEAEFAEGKIDLLLMSHVTEDVPRNGLSGDILWQEPLVWAAASGQDPQAARGSGAVLMLAHAAHPCALREAAQRALDAAGIAWQSVFEGNSPDAALAAAGAGLGVTLIPQGRVGPGLQRLSTADGMPSLPILTTTLRQRKNAGSASDRLARYLGEVYSGQS